MTARTMAAVAFALFIHLSGCSQQAERDRIAAEAKRQQVQHDRQQAALDAEHKQKMAELQKDTERSKAVAREEQIKARLFGVAAAFRIASNHLGRPPERVEELKPHLEEEASLNSPRDQQPFAVAWGEEPKDGKLLIWEATADSDGGRWVFVEVGQARRATAEEFLSLRPGKVIQQPPLLADKPAPPAPKVIIVDPKTGKSVEGIPDKAVLPK